MSLMQFPKLTCGATSISLCHVQLYDEDTKPVSKVAISMLKAYSKNGIPTLQGQVANNASNWIRKAVLLTATAAVDALYDLTQQDPEKREFWRDLIINRILRGVLWTIHNGNAPGKDPLSVEKYLQDRTLECSLSSKWLDSNDIVYIA